MPRPSWKGFIRLSLVSVPVEGYSASAPGSSSISFNQLHEDCGERIRYKKTCPVHGEVPSDEIVKGYEFAKDQYAIIDPDEINKLRSEADRSINIERFISPDEIDPLQISGTSYYLLPSGKQGEKPYAVLHRAMSEAKVIGLAQVVISNREQLVELRPVGRLLVASLLHYPAELKPIGDFEDLLPTATVSAAELKLAKTLIDATHEKEAKLEEFHDLYEERLRELVDAKIAGKEVTKPTTGSAGPPTIDFAKSLVESLKLKKSGRAKPTEGPAASRGKRLKMPKRRTG